MNEENRCYIFWDGDDYFDLPENALQNRIIIYEYFIDINDWIILKNNHDTNKTIKVESQEAIDQLQDKNWMPAAMHYDEKYNLEKIIKNIVRNELTEYKKELSEQY